MSQQINLYEKRLRPEREPLTGRRLALAVGLVVVVLAAWSFVERRAADAAAAELAGVQAEVAASQQKLAALGKSLAERRLPDALKAEVEGARARLAVQNAVMALIDAGGLGNDAGFSALMRGFSHLASNDLWLTGFTVAAGGKEIEIRGRLFDAASLPVYVQRLAGDPAFKGLRFSALELRRVTTVPAPVSASAYASEVAKAPADASSVSRILDFVLRSENVDEASGAAAAKAANVASSGAPSGEANPLPSLPSLPDLVRAPAGAGEALAGALAKK